MREMCDPRVGIQPARSERAARPVPDAGKGRRAAFFILALGFVACAGTRESNGRRAEASGAASASGGRALRLPQILEAVPERPFVDLGPVVVRPPPGINHSEFLLQTADRLHADAFVRERLALDDAYRGSEEIDRLRRVLSVPNRSGSTVGYSPFQRTGEPAAPLTGFYRALRFVSPELPPCILELDELEPEVAKSLASATTLGQEHRILNELLAADIISADRFMELRAQCVAQDPVPWRRPTSEGAEDGGN